MVIGDGFMKKAVTVLLLLSSLSLFSCNVGETIAPVAYTRFISTGTQYVYYSSDVYGLEHGQIEVYKDIDEFNSTYPIADLVFRFHKCLGADDIDEYRYTLVDLAKKARYFDVDIYKVSDVYDTNKHIYLNGNQLIPDNVYESDVLSILTFENSSFIRTNPNGQLDKSKTNTLEYK